MSFVDSSIGESTTRMIARFLPLVLLALVSLVPFAQGAPEQPAAPTPEGETASPPPAAGPSEAELGPPGDLVTLTTGKVYRGFQVVKSSSAEVELEVTTDVSIKIPRRLIASVKFDDIDPTVEREKRKAAEQAATKATMALLSGQKVSPAIQDKLKSDISSPPIKFESKELSEAIAELNKHPGVNGLLVLDQPVANFPEEERKWTFESTPGISLAAAIEILRNTNPKIFTFIRDDKLVITDEKTAKDFLSVQQPPADQSPPPAPPVGQPPAAPNP